jgi:glycosyltransferase involved in cell wall biosynthesis
MPGISVAICSWNRERLLRGTLASLAAAAPPRSLTWELLVILNNCDDNSLAVVDAFRERLPIVCEVEPWPGHSHARNRAVDIASGDFIVWTDDDVHVDRDWLCAYEDAFLRWPEASVFGGPIHPLFEGGIPSWLEKGLHFCDSAFATRSVPQGEAPIVLKGDDLPFGANFALRTSDQRRFRYDSRLGRRPGRWIVGGEELDVIRAILASGGTGRWVPRAVVRHVIPPERQTIRYLRSYFVGHGYVLAQTSSAGARHRRVRESLRDLGAVLSSEAKYRWLRATADPARWVPALVTAAIARGRWAYRSAGSSEDLRASALDTNEAPLR